MSGEGEVLLPDQQHAYRLLVRLSGTDATTFAESAGVSAEAAAETLEALHTIGLATPGPIYHALPPDVALGEILLRRQQELQVARQVMAALSEDYRTNTRRHSAEHLVEIVVGARPLRQRLKEMQEQAEEEILWFCRANPIAMEGPDNNEEMPALKRGVKYRAIYERELVENPGELAGIVEAIGFGEEARVMPSLPVRLAIADRKLAICPLVPDEARGIAQPSAALIRPSELLDALLALFQSHWERATPVLAAKPDEQLDTLLLSLLVSGLPDKSIATHLGVSRRTVQRRLDRMMDLAGVDTRTGLAYQAAKRGWL
jgi:Homeodomain-like domain-containing protein